MYVTLDWFLGLQAVLKYDFREEDKPHNCLDDAIIPMRIVHDWIQHGVDTCSLPPRVKVSFFEYSVDL
jgi:hypothetical protein